MRPLAAVGVACCALSGCHVVLGLDEVPDANPCAYSRYAGDEDCDGLSNAADPCPPEAGPAANADSDGDGVGDACDHGPTTRQQQRLFDPFEVDRGWTAASGAWHFDRPNVVSNDPGDGEISFPVVAAHPLGRVYVEEATGDPAMNPLISIFGADPNGIRVSCTVALGAGGMNTLTIAGPFLGGSRDFPGTGGFVLELAQDPADGGYHCRGHHGRDAVTDVVSGVGAGVATTARVGITTSAAGVVIDSILVTGDAP